MVFKCDSESMIASKDDIPQKDNEKHRKQLDYKKFKFGIIY